MPTRILPNEIADAMRSTTVNTRECIQIEAKERLNPQVVVPFRWWDGTGSQTLTIYSLTANNGQGANIEVEYLSGRGTVEVGNVVGGSGTVARRFNLKFPVPSMAEDMVRNYHIARAPVHIHRCYFTSTGKQIAHGIPVFYGFIDESDTTYEGVSGNSYVEITCASHGLELRRKYPYRNTNEYQRERNPDDSFRRWTSIVEGFQPKWGSV